MIKPKLYQPNNLLAKIIGDEPQAFPQLRKTLHDYCVKRELWNEENKNIYLLNDSIKTLLPESDQKLTTLHKNQMRGLVHDNIVEYKDETKTSQKDEESNG